MNNDVIECKCENCGHEHHCGTMCWDCRNKDVCETCNCEHCSNED